MAKVDVELAERVRAAADAREGSAQAISEALGIDKSNVSRMLNGQRGIAAGELITISDIVGVPLLELLGRPRPRQMRLAARLSAAADMTAVGQGARRAARLVELSDLLGRLMPPDLRERVDVERPATSKRAIDQGEVLAETVRDVLGLGLDPISDLTAVIAAKFDIDVAFEPLDSSLQGLLIRDGAGGDRESALILVNSTGATTRQRFTCAHELGHYLLGHGQDELIYADYPGKDLEEMAANAFASHLLLPRSAVDAATAEHPRPSDETTPWAAGLVGALAGQYGISVESTAWHALNCGVITPDERAAVARMSARDVHAAGGTLAWFEEATARRGMTDPPARTVDWALSAYHYGIVGVGTVAEIYNRDDEDVLQSELADAGWAPDYA